MRVGENLAKNMQTVAQPKRVTVAVLSFVPFLSGYYAEALEVLKVCLENIWQNTDLPYDLLVFDNGSCQETREFLLAAKEQGKIQYLVLSEKNVGKGGAWNLIFQGAPGEIIAYCDGDALLYSGWLSECVKILEKYPNVGMVTARPMRTDPKLYSSTLKWARKNSIVKIKEGQLISFEEFKDFTDTMGYSDRKIKEIYSTTKDVRLEYKGVQSYAGANHFQFVGWKKVLTQFTPFTMNKPLGQVRQLDERMNESGFLRLMTSAPLVQNMSNRVPKNVKTNFFEDEKKVSWKDFPFVKKVLMGIYNRIFRLYFEK
jgi:glycosyltransferase involved in cell wall biosynthesis